MGRRYQLPDGDRRNSHRARRSRDDALPSGASLPGARSVGARARLKGRTALAVLGAWLAPGLGHAILGKWKRGAAYASIVTTAFVAGLLLEGKLYTFDGEHPLTILAALTNHATGLLDFVARGLRLGEGNLTSASYEYGTTYLLSAGLMNLLLILDTFEIARGRKR